jgi:hypothetical protein
VRWLLLAAALVQATTLPVRSVDRGAMSGIAAARQVSIVDESGWNALWREHAPEKPKPAVDFSREMIVAVFLGTRLSAGFGVEITGYRGDGGRIVVEYRETMPSPGAITAQVIVTPYHIAAMPRQPGPITFEKLPQ